MRLGILTSALGGGGAERQARIWAQICAEAGHEVTALVLWPLGSETPPEGVRISHLPKFKGGALATIPPRLRRACRDLDALVAFEPYLAVCAMLAAPPIPWMVVTGKVPSLLRDRSRIPLPLFKRAFAKASLASAPNQAMVDAHRQLGIRRDGPWTVVANVADEAAFVPGAAEREGVLWVGRLDPVKDPLLAVQAAAAAAAPLTILGYGELQGEVEAAIAANDGGPPVRIEGFTGAPWQSFARHRVLAVTSRYESFGNVIVESLAAGTPVVSVDCDFGPREIIGGARFSQLTEPSVEGVSTGLREVLERPYGEAEEAECRTIAERYRGARIGPTLLEAVDSLTRRG